MERPILVRLSVLAVAAMIPASLFAGGTQPAAAAADPNEKLCENVTVVGSRLAQRRVCATRAEWARRRLRDRQDAEGIQRSLTGSLCAGTRANGSPTC